MKLTQYEAASVLAAPIVVEDLADMVGNPAHGVEAKHAGDPGRPVIVLVGHGFCGKTRQRAVSAPAANYSVSETSRFPCIRRRNTRNAWQVRKTVTPIRTTLLMVLAL